MMNVSFISGSRQNNLVYFSVYKQTTATFENLTFVSMLTYAIDRNATHKKVFSAVAWTNVIRCQFFVTPCLHTAHTIHLGTHTSTKSYVNYMLSIAGLSQRRKPSSKRRTNQKKREQNENEEGLVVHTRFNTQQLSIWFCLFIRDDNTQKRML